MLRCGRDAHDFVALLVAELVRGRRERPAPTVVAAIGMLAPSLHRSGREPEFDARDAEPAPRGDGFIEELEGLDAMFVHVSPPSSPQRAAAFFRNTSIAAVSARAA